MKSPPRKAVVRKVKGGFHIDEGLWGFNSGVYHANLDMLGIPVVDDDGKVITSDAPGEVEVRGANVLTEYWRNSAATRESLHDGWFRTGDIAVRDADGYFTIHDRKKNMIVSGGENIYPAEIERVLLEHPLVVEAAVIGVADPRWQEVPVAFVVSREAVSVEDLRAHLQSQVARFKVPRTIVFVETLPRNALGKVQHFRLKESWRGA